MSSLNSRVAGAISIFSIFCTEKHGFESRCICTRENFSVMKIKQLNFLYKADTAFLEKVPLLIPVGISRLTIFV